MRQLTLPLNIATRQPELKLCDPRNDQKNRNRVRSLFAELKRRIGGMP